MWMVDIFVSADTVTGTTNKQWKSLGESREHEWKRNMGLHFEEDITTRVARFFSMHRSVCPPDKKTEGKIDILEELNISKPGRGGFANPNSFCFINKRKNKSCELRHCFMLPLMLLELFLYLILGVFFFCLWQEWSAFCRISDERAVLLLLSISDDIACPQFWWWWSCSLLCSAGAEICQENSQLKFCGTAVTHSLPMTLLPSADNITLCLFQSREYFLWGSCFLRVFWKFIACYRSLKWMY